MDGIWLLIASFAFVIFVVRVLGVAPKGTEKQRRRRIVPALETDKEPTPKRRASRRLFVAVLLFAAGLAIVIVLVIQWVSRWLQGALN